MPTYSKNDVILVRYPFTDLSETKVRPAVVVHAPHSSTDSIIVPLTSRASSLFPDEFILKNWADAGLNVSTTVKRGIFTIHHELVIKIVGQLSTQDALGLEKALRSWLGL